MKEVVERLTCDVGSEVQYSDSETNNIRTVTWAWDGKQYEFDSCPRCIEKVSKYDIGSMLSISHSVATGKASPKKPKTKSKITTQGSFTPLHEGLFPEENAKKVAGGYTCPADGCNNISPTIRGALAHWSRRANKLKAVS